MPPVEREAPVGLLEPLEQRHRLEQDEPLDTCPMLQGEPRRHVRAAVVADDGEALVAERAHEPTMSDAIARFVYGATFDDSPYPRRSGRTTVW